MINNQLDTAVTEVVFSNITDSALIFQTNIQYRNSIGANCEEGRVQHVRISLLFSCLDILIWRVFTLSFQPPALVTAWQPPFPNNICLYAANRLFHIVSRHFLAVRVLQLLTWR